MLEDKIKTLQALQELIENIKKEGKRVVHCHGCFDLVHFGHLQHFLSAKKEGDVLVVTVTPDKFINKGPSRPYFNEEIRLKMLAGFECVDYVALNEWETAIETIKMIKPDVYVKGKEVLDNKDVDVIKWNETGLISNLRAEEEAVRAIGGRLYLTDEITFSSSRILNDIVSLLPENAKFYLREFKKSFSIEQILAALDSLKNIKVLIIGDPIIDEYISCLPMDKSGKESLVSFKHIGSEMHAGGVFAVSNHLSGLAGKVSLVSCFGDVNRKVIDNNLNKNIDTNLFTQKNLEGIVKKRYIDDYRRVKLFEIYNNNELELEEETKKKIIEHLDKNLDSFDMIVVADFGHGVMTSELIEFLTNSRKFLAVSAQLNSGNMGYNFITKYKRADFVSLNDREIRLPFQERKSDIEIPIRKLKDYLNVDKINVTLGKRGSLYYANGKYFPVPAFTQNPIDTIGAGDAVLAISSLLAYHNVEPEIVPFLGNSMGALAVKIVCNRNPVDPMELRKFVNYIMK